MLLIISCEPAGAADYVDDIEVTAANDDQWSTKLSNNQSNVSGNIIVYDGAVLNIENATIMMCRISVNNYPLIGVKNSGILNVNGSMITRGSTADPCNSRYYGWKFESQSKGNITNTTIEYCIYNDGLTIETDEIVSLYNVTFDHGADDQDSSAIYLNSASNTNIRECRIITSSSDKYNYGIVILNSNNCDFSDNSITDVVYNGIDIRNSGHINLSNNNITQNEHGIYLSSSSNNTLRNNTLRNSSDYHLYITGDYDQDIDNSNTVNGGRLYYIYSSNGTITDTNIGHVSIVNCNDLWFTDCTVHNGDGIRIIGSSSNVSIKGGRVENNSMYGINLESTSLNNITSVTIENNTKLGINIDNSYYNTINNSDILSNKNYGIYTSGTSNHNNIVNNNIINNTAGIYLTGDGYNNILNNNVSNNGASGIILGENNDHSSTYNILHNNTIWLNKGDGIIFLSNYNRLSENDISGNSNLAFRLKSGVGYYDNYIWNNNTANGEEVHYYYKEQDLTIQSEYLLASNVNDVGKVTLADCSNITIQHNIFSNNIKSGCGIFLWNSDNNDLTNNTLSNNYNGFKLYGSSSNNIIDLDTMSEQYGTHLESSSNHNTFTLSNIKSTKSNGVTMYSSDHTTLTSTLISSVDQDGLNAIGSDYMNLTNVTITSTSSDGLSLTSSHYAAISLSNITASNAGVYCTKSNYIDIINTIIKGIDGIYMSQSHWGESTDNNINATERGIFLTESRDNKLTSNTITNYTVIGISLEESSTDTIIIGNDLTRDGAEYDIRINDSNNPVITNNESTAENYILYLTNDTRLYTLDTVFNKTKVGIEDTSNLTLMWRIDVLCWDNYHLEPVWAADLTVCYGEFSDAEGLLVWDGEVLLSSNGRLSGNDFDDYGPPDSTSNWIEIIEYKQNVSKKTYYQPMNCTATNWWDKQAGINKIYRNITTWVSEPGVTILVNTGYTPNGKCYYCHVDKLRFLHTAHWGNYSSEVFGGDPEDPYTPGRCIDCHDETDSITIPHGNTSGKDLLHQQSPQLCYNGKGNQICHNASATQARLMQETEFSQTTNHPLGDGRLSCKACHDNHGSECDYDSDLLKKYTTTTSGGYNSTNYTLCLVCHLEEKIVAKMSGESGHLADYMNKTNFRDEYFMSFGGGSFDGTHKNIHSPQTEGSLSDYHAYNNCYCCHNPHGSNYPAMTRYTSKTGYVFNYTYITDVSPGPPEDTDWELLDQANWSDPALNKAGGLYPESGGCGCHGFFATLQKTPPSFNYRTYINYTPAGGPGCVECHDSGRPDALRPIVNVSAMKLAMHKDLGWTLRNDGDLLGKNWEEWGVARGYNASDYSKDNAICWSCHSTNGTPPYPGYHPDRTLNPYKCAKCHGPVDGQPPHTHGLVAAVDNHGPTTKGGGSIYIQTNVGTDGSCDDCHSPSILPENMIDDPSGSIDDLKVWKYGTGDSGYYMGWESYTDRRTTMGDVSHYGLDRLQGLALEIENPLFNTSDCLFCHCNSTNGAIWGNAVDVTDNMYGADTSNLSECYTYCHVLPSYLDTVNETSIQHFHNKSIYSGGGPDCVICHDVDSSYHVQSLVNATSIALGMHGNITNNTLMDVFECDNKSKPCWGCHQSDGTIPEGMGDRNGIIDPDKKPWTCEDCHNRSSEWVTATNDGNTWIAASYPPNKLPPVIYTHHPNSSTVATNVNGEGRCVDCHNESIDTDYNDTAEKVLGNTVYSNVSHYATRSDLIIPTEDCGICHNSIINAAVWGNAPQNTHGIFSNYSAEDGCYSCHTSDDQTPADFHAENLCFGEGGYDCLRCHNTDGFAIDKRINGAVFGSAIHKDMNNASSMDYSLNRSCWVCHFEEGKNADDHSLRKDPPYLCYECHNKITSPFDNVSNAPNVYNHFKDGTSIQAYWTQSTNSISCLGCHNKLEMLISCSENDSYSTDFSITSHYGKNRTDLVDKYNEADSTEYCEYCHKNDSTPFIQWNKLKKINHGGTKTCDKCHGTGRLHNNSLTRVKTKGNCTDCHALYGNAQPGMNYKINVTAMNMGVHANVNSNMRAIAAAAPINDINNAMCWGCHVPQGAYPVEGHKDTFNNDAYLCYECHNGTAAYVNVDSATAVYNHFKEGINITARTDATTNSTSCGYGCHNLTTMKVAGFDAGGTASYRVNLSQASHYACNRTDIAITSDLSDCTWCHRNASNEFIDIFNDQDNAKIKHAVDTSGCILPICHNRGRIHDQELTIPSVNWNECEGCHFGLSSYGSSAYVNQTMFNASVHASAGCTDCHINTTLNHPVEEYTWKWCECCHSYQSEPVTMSDRHNVTRDPLNYTLDVSGDMICVMNITDCTVCHDAAEYNSAVNNAVYGCRYCHAVPDKGNKTAQNWY